MMPFEFWVILLLAIIAGCNIIRTNIALDIEARHRKAVRFFRLKAESKASQGGAIL